MAAISCRNLTHYYGRKCALSDVSWELAPGRIVGLLGRNGAGKTTTINILNAFLEPTSGQCRLLGEDVRRLGVETKSRIGYLMEGHVQYPHLDTRQIERFYSAFYPRWAPAIYYHLLGKLDIAGGQRVGTLSCGQRSQVALGLVLAQQPDLIIFDDYSMGLDPGYRRLFVEVIRDYAADGKRSILLTSHIIQDLEMLVDDVIFYRSGRVLVDTTLANLRSDFRMFSFVPQEDVACIEEGDLRIEQSREQAFISGFLDQSQAETELQRRKITHTGLQVETLTLEDVFIALTGKY